jgi:hypothetical protein
MKSIALDKETDLYYKRAKVRAKKEAEIITKEVNLITADIAQMNSVTRFRTRDPQDVIVVDK